MVESDQIPMADDDPDSRHVRNSVLRSLDAMEVIRLLPVEQGTSVPP